MKSWWFVHMQLLGGGCEPWSHGLKPPPRSGGQKKGSVVFWAQECKCGNKYAMTGNDYWLNSLPFGGFFPGTHHSWHSGTLDNWRSCTIERLFSFSADSLGSRFSRTQAKWSPLRSRQPSLWRKSRTCCERVGWCSDVLEFQKNPGKKWLQVYFTCNGKIPFGICPITLFSRKLSLSISTFSEDPGLPSWEH